MYVLRSNLVCLSKPAKVTAIKKDISLRVKIYINCKLRIHNVL